MADGGANGTANGTPEHGTAARSVASVEAARRRLARVEPSLLAIRYGPHGQRVVNMAADGYAAPGLLADSGKAPARRRISSDARSRSNLDALRAESAELDQNNAVYQAMITRVLDVVLGEGTKLQVKTKDAAENAKREQLWASYWRRPEIRGMDDGRDFERKILRHYLVDGDCLLVRDGDSGLSQLVVADQIGADRKTLSDDGNDIEQGVELDDSRRPLAYRVSPFDRFGIPVASKTVAIDADQCTFLANRRRIDQTRGEPIMQSAFPMIHRINDVCDSETAAWQLLSRLAIAVTSKEAASRAYNTSQPDYADVNNPQRIASRIHDFGHAIVFHGEPGDELKGIERNIPGANFVESLKMFLRILGMPLGFSLEFTLLIWSDTNYSSGRASIKQVERNCKPYRCAVEYALSEIYRWQLARWKADKLTAEVDGDDAHEWHFSPYPFIDPQKEAQAQTEAMKNGTTTATRQAKANGVEFADVVAERASDFALAAKAVAAHNAAYPDSPLSLSDFVPRDVATAGGASDAPADAAVPESEVVKGVLDAYGVGVRAGAITPQDADESHFRGLLGLPDKSPAVDAAWSDDGGTRRPITLVQPGGAAAPPAAPAAEGGDDAE